MRKILKKEFLSLCLIIVLLSQHLIDLDYLLYPLLNQYHLPLFSTIIRYVLMPFLVLLIFYVFETNKKKFFILGLIYLSSVLIYFYLHTKIVNQFLNRVYFTDNFVYALFKEFSYVLTLTLPLAYIYSFYKTKIKKIDLIIPFISLSISIPIVFSNLFLFSNSAYYGQTVANFMSWFSVKYDAFANNPRFYSSVFYFPEANTISILMISLAPILVYLLYQKNNKTYLIINLFHFLAMNLLGTRIGTYGSLIISFLMIIAYLCLWLFKRMNFNLKFTLMLSLILSMSLTLFPFTPAKASISVDQSNNAYVVANSSLLVQRKDGLKDADDLKMGSVAFRDFYIHYFEDNLFLIGYLPVDYYLYNYHYRNDPKFWVDFIFEYTLEERINARQFQNIFMNYKWQQTNFKEKSFGMGWTPFMYSSTDLEQDFKVQLYSFGYVGFSLLVAYWLVMFMYITIKIIFNYHKWNLRNFSYLLALAIGFFSSFVSGHGIDNMSVSIFLSYIMALSLDIVRENSNEI